MAVPFIRLTHTGLHPDGRANTGPVFINDLDTGLEQQNRKVKCYVPVGGFIDIPASSRSLLSFESGTIKKFTTVGVITSQLFDSTAPQAFSNATRPAATLYAPGSMIWNTDDKAPNFSDGTAWYDASGNLT